MQNAMATNEGVRENAEITRENLGIDFLHEIASRIATADPLEAVLARVCRIHLGGWELRFVLCLFARGQRPHSEASKNPHAREINRLRLRMGQESLAGAEHKTPVALARNAFTDPRFRSFNELPEDRYEAFLSVRCSVAEKLVGVINLQYRQAAPAYRGADTTYLYDWILRGAEVQMARLEGENSRLSVELENRKVIERAKGILQRTSR